MAKYLILASYTAEGAKGVLKDGGTKRRQAAEAAIKSAGGKLEEFYFAFGESDAIVIVDAPDHATIASASLAITPWSFTPVGFFASTSLAGLTAAKLPHLAR